MEIGVRVQAHQLRALHATDGVQGAKAGLGEAEFTGHRVDALAGRAHDAHRLRLELGRELAPLALLLPLRVVPVSAVVTAEVGPEVGPRHRKQKRPVEAML